MLAPGPRAGTPTSRPPLLRGRRRAAAHGLPRPGDAGLVVDADSLRRAYLTPGRVGVDCASLASFPVEMMFSLIDLLERRRVAAWRRAAAGPPPPALRSDRRTSRHACGAWRVPRLLRLVPCALPRDAEHVLRDRRCTLEPTTDDIDAESDRWPARRVASACAPPATSGCSSCCCCSSCASTSWAAGGSRQPAEDTRSGRSALAARARRRARRLSLRESLLGAALLTGLGSGPARRDAARYHRHDRRAAVGFTLYATLVGTRPRSSTTTTRTSELRASASA